MSPAVLVRGFLAIATAASLLQGAAEVDGEDLTSSEVTFSLKGRGWCLASDGARLTGPATSGSAWQAADLDVDGRAKSCEQTCAVDDFCIGYMTEDRTKCATLSLRSATGNNAAGGIHEVENDWTHSCWSKDQAFLWTKQNWKELQSALVSTHGEMTELLMALGAAADMGTALQVAKVAWRFFDGYKAVAELVFGKEPFKDVSDSSKALEDFVNATLQGAGQATFLLTLQPPTLASDLPRARFIGATLAFMKQPTWRTSGPEKLQEQLEQLFMQALTQDEGRLLREKQKQAYSSEPLTSWGGAEEALYGIRKANASRAALSSKAAMGGNTSNTSWSQAFSIESGHCSIDSAGCITSPGYPGHYSNREACTISIDPRVMVRIHVREFLTERVYDSLTVNGIRYSGTRSPDGVIPVEDILWYTDHDGTRSGWRICATEADGESESSLAMVDSRAPAGAKFNILEGGCTVDESGCMKSPNHPWSYGNNETCEIEVVGIDNGSVPLAVDAFETEFGMDALRAGNVVFSGLDGPDGVLVTSGTVFHWASDSSSTMRGWRICFGATAPSRSSSNESSVEPENVKPAGVEHVPQESDNPLKSNTTVFYMKAGSCSVDEDGCARSPGFPLRYRHRDSCIIGVHGGSTGPIEVETFNTERGYDALLVNGVRYSGRSGPSQVTPYEDLVWHTDEKTDGGGWRICPTSPLPAIERKMRNTLLHAEMMKVSNGECLVDKAGCIASPSFPMNYTNNGSCRISVHENNTLPLYSAEFATEARFDTLQVNGIAYSGVLGPDGIVPRGQLTWSTDGENVKGGWKLCLRAAQPSTGGLMPTGPWEDAEMRRMFIASLEAPLLSLTQSGDAFMNHAKKTAEALVGIEKEARVDQRWRFEEIVNVSLEDAVRHWTGLGPLSMQVSRNVQRHSNITGLGVLGKGLPDSLGAAATNIGSLARTVADVAHREFQEFARVLEFAAPVADIERGSANDALEVVLEEVDNFAQKLHEVFDDMASAFERSLERRAAKIQEELPVAKSVSQLSARGFCVHSKAWCKHVYVGAEKDVEKAMLWLKKHPVPHAAFSKVRDPIDELTQEDLEALLAQGEEVKTATRKLLDTATHAAWSIHSASFKYVSTVKEASDKIEPVRHTIKAEM